MTAIMSKDEAQKLLDRMTFEVVNGELDRDLAEEIGRSLLAAYDEIDRLRADLAAAQAQIEALRNAAALVIRWFEDYRPDLIGPRIDQLRKAVWPPETPALAALPAKAGE